jgi:hypothetical protein
MKDAKFLTSARAKFVRAEEAHRDNRTRAEEDIRFARLGEQWPAAIKEKRESENRPCLTLSEFNSFVRRVVNEARANRPSIQVVPAEDGDKETAEIIGGLIRNIEVSSHADIAYDTAVDGAVSGGFGYFRINTAYTSDDTFDQDIVIERIADQFSVYPDPDAQSADGSDWNCCFIVKSIAKDEFAEQYKNAEKVNWDADGYEQLESPWYDEHNVLVAEYWRREIVEKEIIALDNDTVVPLTEYREREQEYMALGIMPVGEPRKVRSHKVMQYLMTGAEVLEENEWPGKWIPIVPVYGDEIVIDGERTFRSLIHDAKDAGREKNYWRSYAAEMVALAPKIPFVGPEGAFDGDTEKWSAINDESIPFVTYRGPVPPQRQQGAQAPYAEMQQAMAAVDDMKAIIGLHSPSMGQRSGADSGIAIRSLQRQADIGTFHFLDNLTRSIRHAGRILIDLIAKVYTTPRIIRTLGEDMQPQMAAVAPAEAQGQEQDMARLMQRLGEISRIYDLTAGKYDLVVKAGPAYGTQREYARAEMAQIISQMGESAARVIAPLYLRNSDWPGADEIADKLEAAEAAEGQQGQQEQPDMAMQAMMQQMQQQMQQLAGENNELKQQAALKAQELQIKAFEAETRRLEVQARAQNDAMGHQVDAASAAMQARQSNPFTMEGTL